MSRVLLLAVLLAASVTAAHAGRLDGKVKRLIAQSPVGRQGFVGVFVVDESGHKLLAINSSHAFIPASNAKLFAVALALEKLGPGKRFETRVERRGDDLVLIGTGDPNLSGRVIPYEYNSSPGAPLGMIDELALQIATRGIHEVRNVFGDDTIFPYVPFARGWAIDDILNPDGAPVSALLVNDDEIAVRITPGTKDGDPVQVTLSPPVPQYHVENSAVTGSPENIHADRIPGSEVWRIWGSMPAGADPHTESWAVTDPAQFAAAALKYSLEQHGVHVSGDAQAIHRFEGTPFTAAPSGEIVATHQSQPLVEDLRLTQKTSQNLHADLLLADVGGSREQGLRELAQFLGGIGITPEQYRLYDGSGLSRMDLVTPEAVVSLLRYMAHSPHAEDWLSLLPVAGVDGSLGNRLNGRKVKGRIRAKTGSLNHVSALSGYAEDRKGRRLTFSILVNNAFADTAAQRELIDKICSVLVD